MSTQAILVTREQAETLEAILLTGYEPTPEEEIYTRGVIDQVSNLIELNEWEG